MKITFKLNIQKFQLNNLGQVTNKHVLPLTGNQFFFKSLYVVPIKHGLHSNKYTIQMNTMK